MTIFAAVHPTTYLAAGYGLVLLAVAYGIDLMARRAGRTLEARQNPGFTYHESHDAWLCPEDQWLWPQSYDPASRVMRYRGSPSICNACPVKDTCTTSLSGREVTREVDPWPASEAAKFHRGIACTIAGLGAIWPIATLVSGPGVGDAVILGVVTLVILAGSAPLWLFLVRTKADPTGVLEQGADANIAARRSAASAYDARRTTYRSDRQADAQRRDDILGSELTPMVEHGSAPKRSSWREVAAAIDAAPIHTAPGTTQPATTHHRYRSDRIRAENEAIERAEEEVKSTA